MPAAIAFWLTVWLLLGASRPPERAASVLSAVQVCGHDPEQAYIPAGEFWMGSTREEREYAYRLDKGITRAYGWYEREARRKIRTRAFCIDRYPVTQAQYKAFMEQTGRAQPYISPEDYQRQGFLVHPYERVREFLWRDGSFPTGRGDHPVVLVSHDHAAAHCAWKGRENKRDYRLPTEPEWEKAARGTDGRFFPWGNQWHPEYLNSGDRFGSTTPADHFSEGRSPYGVYDMAGNVFEWTQTPWDKQKFVLKGCSWDDLPGTCRAAMRHGRPASSKHILIGFRCAAEAGGR